MVLAAILISAAGLLWLINHWRRRLVYKFNLRKNCLLTTHPIVFLSSFRSPFYFGRYWNYIPDWLEAHGYDVLEFQVQGKTKSQRVIDIANFLNFSKTARYHLIADDTLSKELHEIAKLNLPGICSLWITTSQEWENDEVGNSDSSQVKYLTLPTQKLTCPTYWKPVTWTHQLFSKGFNPSLLGLANSSGLPLLAHRYLDWAILLAENERPC